MFVSSAMIYQRLSEVFFCKLYKNPSTDFFFKSAEIFTGNEIPKNDIVYVFDFLKNKDKDVRFDLVISLGTPSRDFVQRCGCVIELLADIPATAVLNQINRVFSFYMEWDCSLRNTVLQGGSIENLIDLSVPVFGNPIGIHDAALNCVAQTDSFNIKDEQDTTTRRSNPTYINQFLIDPDFLSSLQRQGAFFTTGTDSSRRCVVKNIIIEDKFEFRIVIPERFSPLNAQSLSLLEHLSSYIYMLLNNTKAWQELRGPSTSELLQEILDGTARDLSATYNRFATRGWLPNDYYLFVVFQNPEIDLFEYTEATVCSRLKQYLKNAEVFMYKRQIVAVADAGPSITRSSDIIRPFLEFMRDMNMKCGVSNLIQSFRYLQAQYVQASTALRIGQNIKEHNWVFHFDDYAHYFIMEQCVQSLPFPAVCAPKVLHMISHDNEHNTSYFQTLKSYLDNNFNLTDTAQDLFIHRTTLLYRLKKMDELFKLDLDDPLRRLYYHLSVQIVAYTSARDTLLSE